MKFQPTTDQIVKFASVTKRIADLGSKKWDLHFRGRELSAQGIDILELTIGEPDVPPESSLLEACAKAMHDGRTKYSVGRGEPSVIDAIVRKYRARTSGSISPENVLYFPGTQAGLFATILGLAEKGCSVLVGDPYYATYEGVIAASGADLVPVPLSAENGFRMCPELLENSISDSCRILLLNNPNNPTGSVLSREEVLAICEVCEAHDLWIVADEVYEHLVFEKEFVSPLEFDRYRDRVVVISSISKSHAAPGFRSGWAVGSKEYCDHILPLSETMLFGSLPFVEDATAHALNNPGDIAKRMRANYQSRAKLVALELKRCQVLKVIPPEAGMFILVDVSKTGLTGEEFGWGLLEHKHVAVMPGSSFGSAASQFVRLSLTIPDEDLSEACRRISNFAIYCQNEDIPKQQFGVRYG